MKTEDGRSKTGDRRPETEEWGKNQTQRTPRLSGEKTKNPEVPEHNGVCYNKQAEA